MPHRPLSLPCGLVLSNRIAKTAMTEGLADHGQPSSELATLYRVWAEGGASLLITGSVYADRSHVVRPRDVVAEGADLEAWRAWAAAARTGGAKALVQINHPGRQTLRAINPEPIAPSMGRAVGNLRVFGTPREATPEDIEHVIGTMVEMATLAERAGFDGVQVHAAHGYLLSQFLSSSINRRTDRWGGSLANRARLLRTIVREVRRAVAPGFAVAVKLNSSDFQRDGLTEDEAAEVVRMLDEDSIDLLEISGGNYEQPASFGVGIDGRNEREAYFLDFAERARGLTNVPIMLTGGIRSRATVDRVLGTGVDLVGLGRPLCVAPDLPRRMLEDPEAAAPRVRAWWLGSSRFDPAAELAWYYQQLRRLADGRAPSLSVSASLALGRYIYTDMLAAERTARVSIDA